MSGEPGLRLAVGGEVASVECPGNPAALHALSHDLTPFVTDGPPTLAVRVEFDPSLQEPATPGWKALGMRRSPDGYVAEGPSHWMRLSLDLGSVEARIRNYFQMASVFRIALSTLLPLRGVGFLAHAAAVASGDGAYLFPGISGAGKSTLVANSPGRRCLSEENAVVRRENGAHYVLGFPLWARLDMLSMTREPTRLRGMFLLKKGAPGVRPVERREALPYLLRSVCFPLADPASRERVLDVCSRFVDEVPVAELEFARNPDFWRWIERD